MNNDGRTELSVQNILTATSGAPGTTTHSAAVSSGGYRFALFLVSVDMSSKTLEGAMQDSADGVNFDDIPGSVFTAWGTAQITAKTFLVRFESVRPFVRMRLTRVTGSAAPSVTCVRYGEKNTTSSDTVFDIIDQ